MLLPSGRDHVKNPEDFSAVLDHLPVADLPPTKGTGSINDEGGSVGHVPILVEEELRALRVGAELARLRQRKGLSQPQLAAKAGMSGPNVSRLKPARGRISRFKLWTGWPGRWAGM